MRQIASTILLMLLMHINYAQNGVMDVLISVTKNNKSLIANTQYAEAKKLEYRTGLTPNNPRVDYDYMIGSPAGAGNQTDFSVTQSFDFPSAYFSKKSMANEQIARTELELNALRQSILLEAKTNCYFLIFLNKKKLELKRRVSQVSQVYDGYQTKLKNGEATMLDGKHQQNERCFKRFRNGYQLEPK